MFGLGMREATILVTILVFLAVFVLPPLIISYFHNGQFKKQNPNCLSYWWGYFQGWSAIFASIFLLMFGLNQIFSANGINEGLFYSFFSVFFALAGFGVVWRKKWGWIVLCVLNISTGITLVIDIFYAKNRWIEFSSVVAKTKEALGFEDGSAFWIGSADGAKRGPFDLQTIKKLVSTCEVTTETLVWKEGMPAWLPASETVLSEFFAVEPPPLPTNNTQKEITHEMPSIEKASGLGHELPEPESPTESRDLDNHLSNNNNAQKSNDPGIYLKINEENKSGINLFVKFLVVIFALLATFFILETININKNSEYEVAINTYTGTGNYFITATVVDKCNDNEPILYRFYDKTNNLVWPSGDSHYFTEEYGVSNKISLRCTNGALICFGGQTPNGRAFWGVGLENEDPNATGDCVVCGEAVEYPKDLICE